MEDINKKTLAMAKRVYNNTMTSFEDGKGNKVTDEDAIKAMVGQAFTSNNDVNNIQAFRDFNKLIVTTAEDVAKPKIEQIIGLVSKYQKVGANDVQEYDLATTRTRITTAITATGTGVDFTRIPSYAKKKIATPRKHQFGAKYNVSRMVSDPINEFKNAVNYVAEEKVAYIVKQIYSSLRNAVNASRVPVNQIVSTANISFADFRKAEASLLRYGNNVNPVFIGDVALINSLAEKQGSEVFTSTALLKFLTDDLRKQLLNNITFDQISRSIAITIDNPWTDEANSKTDLPINEGILIAGGSESPFRVTEFGDMTVATNEGFSDIEGEEVLLKITYKADITLLLNRAVGYIKDTSII